LTLPERDLGYLEDIRSNAADALSIAGGKSYDEFVTSVATRHALLHCLTIIGEVAGRLSPAAHEQFPQFAWTSMKGMRHILVHEYGRVNYEKVWEVVTDELPALSAELGRYLEMIE
jgi:uncharacterized protein with HEPN domain